MKAAALRADDCVYLALEDIRTDGGTQSRVGLTDSAVEEYAEKYQKGVAMPPVVVFYDGSVYWLADGFHRCAGAERAGAEQVIAEVRQGDRRDAVLFSVGANATHAGEPRQYRAKGTQS